MTYIKGNIGQCEGKCDACLCGTGAGEQNNPCHRPNAQAQFMGTFTHMNDLLTHIQLPAIVTHTTTGSNTTMVTQIQKKKRKKCRKEREQRFATICGWTIQPKSFFSQHVEITRGLVNLPSDMIHNTWLQRDCHTG